MKILFIHPSAPVKDAVPTPPLGLAYLAAALEKEKYNVRILDMSVEEMSERQLQDYLRAECPNVIGITAMTPTFYNAVNIAREVKKSLKDSLVIMGGTHPTILPDAVLGYPEIDIVVRGEGEVTIVELLRALTSHGNLTQIDGTSFKKNGEIIHNPDRQLIQDLNTLPFPSRDLLSIDKYKGRMNGRIATSMLTTRGCPFKCAYCYRGPAAGKIFRARSPEIVIEEIKEIVNKYNIRAIRFWDDIFTLNQKRIHKICDLLIENKLDISWDCETRVDCVNLELLKKMKKAGCYKVLMGVESGSEKILKLIDKRITKEQCRQAFKMAKEARLITKAFFMIGLPWDTKDTVEETIDFAKELNPDLVQFSLTMPYPGTKLWEVAKESNITLNEDWDSYFMTSYSLNLKSFNPVFETDELTKEDLLYYMRSAHSEWLKNKIKNIRSIEDLSRTLQAFTGHVSLIPLAKRCFRMASNIVKLSFIRRKRSRS